MRSPVAIFVYNRVGNTQQTVEALLRNTLAKETDVYVFSDGGKDEASWKKVKQVRAYLRKVKQEVDKKETSQYHPQAQLPFRDNQAHSRFLQ